MNEQDTDGGSVQPADGETASRSVDGIERSGLPLRDVGVECENCGSEKRRPDSNRCAACGQFAPDPRYAYSELTDTWYRITEYDDLGDGKVVAKSKEPVDREDVPQQRLDAMEGSE